MKKMFFLFLVVSQFSLLSQSTFSLIIDSEQGDIVHEAGFGIMQLRDGNYFVQCVRQEPPYYDQFNRYYLINGEGEVVKHIDYFPTEDWWPSVGSLVELEDNMIYLRGGLRPNSERWGEMSLVKVDLTRDTVKRISPIYEMAGSLMRGMAPTLDGHLVNLFSTVARVDSVYIQATLDKFNTSGARIWRKHYPNLYESDGVNIDATVDGGFVFSIISGVREGNEVTREKKIYRVGELGDTLWTYLLKEPVFRYTPVRDMKPEVCYLPQSGNIAYSWAVDSMYTWFDPNGDTIAHEPVNALSVIGFLNENGEFLNETVISGRIPNEHGGIQAAANGDALFYSYGYTDRTSTTFPYDHHLITLIRLSPSGEIKWIREYAQVSDINFPFSSAIISDMKATADNGAIMTGSTRDFDEDGVPTSINGMGIDDIFVLKVDSMGCLEPGCGDDLIFLSSENGQLIAENHFIQVYPNPFQTSFKVNYALPESAKRGRLEIYDVNGQMIQFKELNIFESSLEVHLNHQISGVYFYRLYADDVHLKIGKVVKE